MLYTYKNKFIKNKMKKRILIGATIFLLIATLGSILGLVLIYGNRDETQNNRNQEEKQTTTEETTYNLNSYRLIFEHSSINTDTTIFWNYSDYTQVREPNLLNMEENELVEKLYEKGPQNLYYVGEEKDEIFELYPGFYRKLYLTNEIPEISIEDEPEYIETEVSCTQRDVEINNKKAVAQRCTTRIVTQEAENESNITNCYLPTENELYVAYVQEGNISNSTYNLCSELEQNGLKDWHIEKIQKIQNAQDSGFHLNAEYIGSDTWSYTITGDLDNPCVETEVSVNKQKPTDQTVEVILKTKTSNDPCIQVIEPFSLSDEFSAKPDTEIEFRVEKS